MFYIGAGGALRSISSRRRGFIDGFAGRSNATLGRGDVGYVTRSGGKIV